MALLDFLKRKEEVKKAKPAKTAEKVSTAKKAEKKPVAVETKKTEKSGAKGFSYAIVKEPHISEKATYLAEVNQYIFKVNSNTNKSEIKKSIEGIYGVNVLSVNIIKIPHKKRRIGKTEGFRKGYTKAVVKIKEGQKIEIL